MKRRALKGSACQVVSASLERKATVGMIADSANSGGSWGSLPFKWVLGKLSSFLILILGLNCLWGLLSAFLSKTRLVGFEADDGDLSLSRTRFSQGL